MAINNYTKNQKPLEMDTISKKQPYKYFRKMSSLNDQYFLNNKEKKLKLAFGKCCRFYFCQFSTIFGETDKKLKILLLKCIKKTTFGIEDINYYY